MQYVTNSEEETEALGARLAERLEPGAVIAFTGDLGAVGSQLMLDTLKDNGVDLKAVHQDCGLLLYDRQAQDVHAGGSGCGCSASVLCGHLLGRMERGELKNILFCATGALMSTTSQQQGEGIPGVCHVVHLAV